MEKLNAIYTDPNQHSSRKTKYQHQKLKKKNRWISTMERTAQLIINKKKETNLHPKKKNSKRRRSSKLTVNVSLYSTNYGPTDTN